MLDYIHSQREVFKMKLIIEQLCEKKKLTRYELAKRLNVTYPTIDRIYKGQSTSIKLEILENLCNILNCTPNDILIPDKKDDTK